MAYLFLAFFITFISLKLLISTKLSLIALDKPNDRSLHSKLTPRTGGIAVMAGILIAWLSLSAAWYWLLLPFSLMAISFMDDIWHLSAKSRLVVQILVCTLFALVVLDNMSVGLTIASVFLMTWMTNLYNFMDGSDGLAGGMGLFGFGTYTVAAYLVGDMQLAQMCICVSVACFAFLLFNFHPAKIFMGDSGSIPLGFLAGAFGLFGWQQEVWPAWFPFLVFSPFIVDATATLIKRLLKKEKIWEAHKSHYYQRLIQIGWGHRKTALVEYMLMFCAALSAILFMALAKYVVILGLLLWVLIYALLMRVINKRWQAFDSMV